MSTAEKEAGYIVGQYIVNDLGEAPQEEGP